jgi:hypothetical protein
MLQNPSRSEPMRSEDQVKWRELEDALEELLGSSSREFEAGQAKAADLTGEFQTAMVNEELAQRMTPILGAALDLKGELEIWTPAGTHEVEVRHTARPRDLQPEDGHGRICLRQSSEQGDEAVHAARQEEDRRAVATLHHGPQHREDRWAEAGELKMTLEVGLDGIVGARALR